MGKRLCLEGKRGVDYFEKGKQLFWAPNFWKKKGQKKREEDSKRKGVCYARDGLTKPKRERKGYGSPVCFRVGRRDASPELRGKDRVGGNGKNLPPRSGEKGEQVRHLLLSF